MFGVNTFRIIGFDPSVDNMGVGILEVDIRTYKVICAQSFTLKGKDHVKRYAHIAKIHGDRVAKLHGHYNAILNIFDQWDPHAVAIETPFLGRFPAAYGALKECVCIVNQALLTHDFSLKLNEIDPNSVKNALGVSGSSKDKDDMQKALIAKDDISWERDVNPEELDEHSVDAVAVAYWFYEFQFGPYIKRS